MDDARSLVLLLGTLAASVTYQAGLDPPGGVWQSDGDGHLAGDPILQATNPRRYKAFFYCNSTAFMASLAAIVLVQKRSALRYRTLKAVMILDLFGLIGAYAAGSSRDTRTSVCVVALSGAVVMYVAVHAFLFTSCRGEQRQDDDEVISSRRKRQLMFAIVAATITYQAGLTPPGGFWPEHDATAVVGHRAGDPVLFSNFPHRYGAFFYSNSLSFVSAVVHIVLLVNPDLYKPAIRSYALSVCTAAGLLGLVAAYAAGCTQHMKMSIYVFLLAFLGVAYVAGIFLVGRREEPEGATSNNGVHTRDLSAVEAGGSGSGGGSAAETATDGKATTGEKRRGGGGSGGDEDEAAKEENRKKYTKRKYLMLLGILMASVTYQAGLEPPGGTWQTDGGGYAAGDPVLRTNRRFRYLFFFHCNSTSFVASVVVIVLLIPERLEKNGWWLAVTNATVVVNLLGLLGAHAAGSSRGSESSGWYFVALIIAAAVYGAVKRLIRCRDRTTSQAGSTGRGVGCLCRK